MVKLFEAAKALVAAVVTAVGGIVTTIVVATADKAISFDEARGIWLALTAALTTIGAAFGVYRTRNRPPAPAPVPETD